MAGYIDQKKVKSLRWLRRNKGLSIGTTNGCFDLLHPGHVSFLRRCSNRIGTGGVLVVLVNDDHYCMVNKGQGRPVVGENDRLAMVRAIKGVDYAWLFSESSPAEWIEAIAPDVHFKGADWKGMDVPEERFAPVEYLTLRGMHSTTMMIGRIIERFGDRE